MLRAMTLLLALAATPATAQDKPGDFDYYVLSLSWSPNWCAREGRARRSPQCEPGADFGWILHGLWPQYDRGYPEFCQSAERPPSRADTAAMADIMGTSGLAWYQWNKHGTCTGLSPAAYYDMSRKAYDAVARPDAFRQLDRAVTLPASLIEEAFLRDNPGIDPDGLTVTCRDGGIQEVRVCLTRTLDFRICGTDVIRDCTLQDAMFEPIE